MSTFNQQAGDFLAQKRIAVAGVSRSSDGTGNYIYKTLRSKGYQVFPINPHAQELEGDRCYPDLKSVPEDIDGVICVTTSEQSLQIAHDCVQLGITRLWMHENAFAGASATSISTDAVKICWENGIDVIPGGCPMMFLEFGHKCMRMVMGIFGKLPQ